MVLGISATHKVLDTCSLSTFLTDWTSLARRNDTNFVLTDQLVPTIAKFLPPTNGFSPPAPSIEALFSREVCVTNVYVFNPSSIAELKMKVASENIPKPSRVEVVTSVMWKFLTANSKKSSLLSHMVNMRKRVDPPMYAHCIGNFLGMLIASKEEESEKDIINMVAALRKGLSEFDDHYGKRLKGDEAMGTALELGSEAFSLVNRKDEVDLYYFSSWCGYSFYDVDFGWGKPIMFSTLGGEFRHMIFLLDTKDGGVEAMVTLSEEDMEMLERNSTELLTYATLRASFSNKE